MNSKLTIMNQEFVKFDKFGGRKFVVWKDKLFLLTALKISYILDSDIPSLIKPTPEDNDQVNEQRKKQEEDKLLCKGHTLNNKSGSFYNLFTSVMPPKEIWKALGFKLNSQKQGVDKFQLIKHFEYSMVDNVSIIGQVQQLQILVFNLK